MPKRLSCRLDRELDRALSHYADRNHLTISQATRELLRQVLTDADDVSRGWREGFSRGCAEVLESQQRALHELETQ